MGLLSKVRNLNLSSIHPAVVDSKYFPLQCADTKYVALQDSILVFAVFIAVISGLVFNASTLVSFSLFFGIIALSTVIRILRSRSRLIRDTKLFGGDPFIPHYYRSELIKTMEGEGYIPATLRQALSWAQKNWNGKDIVIIAGSACTMNGVEYIPVLQRSGIGLFEKKAELEFGMCKILGIKK